MRVICRTAFTAAIWFFATAAYAGSDVSLSLVHDGRDASAANSVAVTLSNGTDHDIFIYGYNSVFTQPDGRTTSNWLSLTDAFGHEVLYKGRYVVMGAPPPSLFIRIRSGEHLDAKVDLSREYDLPPAGSVTVRTSVAIYERVPVILPNGESESIPHESVESNAVTFVLASAGSHVAATASTIQCTAEQQDATSRAIATARAWAEGKIIHLCPVNFTDPITGGITSQAGTIAHEISHQGDDMAKATVDIDGVRDRASAHALPRSSAVRSAANYEYFITNAPLGRSPAEASGSQ